MRKSTKKRYAGKKGGMARKVKSARRGASSFLAKGVKKIKRSLDMN